MSPSHIKEGFRATGIYPFNQYAIFNELYAPVNATEQQNTLHEQLSDKAPDQLLIEAIVLRDKHLQYTES